MSDPFEDRLARLPRAQLDPGWRAEILGAAFAAAAAAAPRSHRRARFGGWTWAWSALAAAWVAIVALNRSAGIPHLQPGASRWTENAPANLVLQMEARRRLLSAILEDQPMPELSPRIPPNPDRLPPRGDRSGPGFGRRCEPAHNALA